MSRPEAPPGSKTFELHPGGYTFGERAILRIIGDEGKTHAWLGLDNGSGSCLGVLDGAKLRELGREIRKRMGE